MFYSKNRDIYINNTSFNFFFNLDILLYLINNFIFLYYPPLKYLQDIINYDGMQE